MRCPICKKDFQRKDNYQRHVKLHDKTIKKQYNCSKCTYASHRLGDLKRHLKLVHQKAEKDINAPDPSTEGDFEASERRETTYKADHEQSSTCDQPVNSIDSQILQTDEDLTRSSDDDPISEIIRENYSRIKTWKEVTRRAQDRYNFRILAGNLSELETFVLTIWREQKYAFKLNLSLGFILQDLLTDQLSFYYASRNNRLFVESMLVQRRDDVQRFIEQLETADLLEYCRQQRPNSRYVVRAITNAYFYVDKILKYRIGCPFIEIPDYIKRRGSLKAFDRDAHGQLYGDNLCFFRCLAYHYEATETALTARAKTLLERYKGHTYSTLASFRGIELEEIPDLEDFFRVNIQVFCLQLEESNAGDDENDDGGNDVPNEFAKEVFVSRSKYDGSPMCLNLYQNHFSFITNFNAYVRRWSCSKCYKLFNRYNNMTVHQRTCAERTKLSFPGGGYGKKKSVFELLQEHGICVADHLRYFPFRIAYDYECISVPTDRVRGPKERITAVLVPVSVSVCSNVPGYTEPICFVSDGDPKSIVTQMYTHIVEISARSNEILTERFSDILEELDDYVQEYDSLADRIAETDDGDLDELDEPLLQTNISREDRAAIRDQMSRLQIFKDLHKRLTAWLERIVCLGFNSGKFDLNLIRKYLFPYFLESDIKVNQIIKRDNDYLAITTPHAVFLDIKNYLAAGISYDKWLRSYDIKQTKGFFPYEWMTCIEKLNDTKLPSRQEFWSNLKQETITEEQYQYLENVWRENGFSTIRDLLVWYNNLDVVPFLTAAEKLFQYWVQLGIDPFKGNSISLPGLALCYLSEKMAPNTILPIFDEQNKDIYHLIRRNIVGGLSVVMHRYHERLRTLLPNGNTVSRIFSHDCNSLYLWALGQPTGTGLIHVWRTNDPQMQSQDWVLREGHDVIRERERWHHISCTNMSNHFYKERGFCASKFELEWVEWLSVYMNERVDHKFNGRQKTITFSAKQRYPVDGYISRTRTVLQFHGCYWHGHGCLIDQNREKDESKGRKERTDEISARLRSLGYNVVEKWECEWRKDRQTPVIRQFLRQNFETNTEGKNCLSGHEIVAKIQSDEIFGLIECDIEVPWFDSDTIDYYQEFPPICKHAEISLSDVGEHMREYAQSNNYMKRPRKNLINSFFARKLLLATPLVRWLLNNRLHITRIYQFIEMKQKSCFAEIVSLIAENRRAADANPAHKSSGESWKTLGNSLYGKAMTNKERHKDTEIVKDAVVSAFINDRRFHKMEEVGDNAYEVSMDKKRITIDLPLTVAKFVYDYAKLRMLEFVYDFLKTYLRPGSYQMVCSDTDSIIAAYESDELDYLVKAEKLDEYFSTGKRSFLSHDRYSSRTPGLFKVELSATGIVALCAKTYFAWNDDDGSTKCSSKGISKKTNHHSRDTFLRILNTAVNGAGRNYGFKLVNGNLCQYEQQRDGLAYLYVKRRVLNDGISTVALTL